MTAVEAITSQYLELIDDALPGRVTDPELVRTSSRIQAK